MRKPIHVLIYPTRTVGDHRQYLLLKRVPDRGAFWQGVTGGVENGESLLEAARRELIEETGLSFSVIKDIDYSYSFPIENRWQHNYAVDVKEIVEHVFVACLDYEQDPVIDPDEHDAWKWCFFDEAIKLLTWPENIEALQKSDRYLNRARHWEKMLRNYYTLVDWDPETGVPLPETLENLGLGHLVDDLNNI